MGTVTTGTLTIGVDIGGTKVAAGVVDEQGTIVATAHRDTPAEDVSLIEGVIAAAVGDLTSKYDVAAVGVGAAGFIDAQRATVMFSPNLAWRGEPLRATLTRRLGLPVVVENDANAAAWAPAGGWTTWWPSPWEPASAAASWATAGCCGDSSAPQQSSATSPSSRTGGAADAACGVAGSSTSVVEHSSGRPSISPVTSPAERGNCCAWPAIPMCCRHRAMLVG